MILIFDGQRCFLPIGFNNLFDGELAIPRGSGQLFDASIFIGCLACYLNF